jgi:hypothetical protein
VTDADASFARPVLNSPYEYPRRHWEFGSKGQPTQWIVEGRPAESVRHPFRGKPGRASQQPVGSESRAVEAIAAAVHHP